MLNELTELVECHTIYVDLKTIMDKKKVSINELSRLTGVRYHIVKKYYLNQVYRVDLENLKKFCVVLNCVPGDIIKIKFSKM